MAVKDDDIGNSHSDLKLKKCIETLKEPAKRAKLSLIDSLQKSKNRFNDEITKLESEKEKSSLLNKLGKIIKDLDILTNLVEDDIIKFALTTQDKVMTIAANPRVPKLVRMKARVASHKPLSTHLARIKPKLNEPPVSDTEEEIAEEATKTLDKMSLNNQIVKMRKNIKQAKVFIIHKLTRNVASLRKYKGNDVTKAKLERKADRMVKKIKYIKEVRVDDVSRFALTTTLDLNKLNSDINSPMRLQAMATIVVHKIVAAPVAEFKSKFPNWQKTVPKILAKKKKKRKLDVETKVDNTSKTVEPILKTSRKAKNSVPLRSETEEGDSENEESSEEEGSENEESSKDGGSENEESSKEGGNENEGSNEGGSEIEESIEEGSIENEESSENEESGEEGCGRYSENSFQESSDNNQCDEDSNPSEKDRDSQKSSKNKLNTKNNRKIIKERERVCHNKNIDKISNSIKNNIISDEPNESEEEESSEKYKSATSKKRHNKTPDVLPKKIKLSSNIKVKKKLTSNKNNDNKLNARKTNSKIKPSENVPKVVDPFFMTSTNEDFVTSQLPVVPSIGEENPFEARKTSMSTRFSKINDKSSQGFKRGDWKQNSWGNRESQPFKKPLPNNFDRGPSVVRKPVTNIFANRKDRRLALHQPPQEEKVEKLHPSWEAKKKQTSIAAFQGKKMTFD